MIALVCKGAMFSMLLYDRQLSSGIRSAISVGVQPRVMPTSTESTCSSIMAIVKKRMDPLMIALVSMVRD